MGCNEAIHLVLQLGQFGGQRGVGLTDLICTRMLAQGLHTHHFRDQCIGAEHRGEALELVQPLVGSGHIASSQALFDAGQVVLQALTQGVHQGHDTCLVGDVVHGAGDRQVLEVGRGVHG